MKMLAEDGSLNNNPQTGEFTWKEKISELD